MSINKKKARILALLSLGILAVSIVAYGAVKYMTSITNNVTITGYELQLWRSDTNAQVTAINWGSLTQGTVINTETLWGWGEGIPGMIQLKVKNSGDYAALVSWYINGSLPNGVTVTCDYWPTLAVWTSLPQNATFGLNGLPVPVGSFSDPLRFTLSIPASTPRQSFSFGIVLDANS